MFSTKVRFPLYVVLAGLLLGLAGDQLFFGNPPGISVPIFALLLLITLLVLVFVEEREPTLANTWLLIPIIYFAVMSAVRAAPFLVFLNLVWTVLLTLLLAHVLLKPPLSRLNLGQYMLAWLESSVFTPVMATVPAIGAIEVLRGYTGGNNQIARRIAIGAMIAAPFLCIFTVLFASADLVFNLMLENTLDRFRLADLPGHMVSILMIAWLITGLLAYALSRVNQEETTKEGVDEEPAGEIPESEAASGFNIRRLIGMVEAGIVLFSIDLLFILFVGIQFAAFFGGEAFLLRQNLTYSEYARRGFFELVAVAGITLSMILALDFVTRRESAAQRRLFLAGSGVMIGMTVIILGSAFWRMALYEIAYGFTRLRLHTHVFMVWLALLLVFFLIVLAIQKTRMFATGALLTALGFTLTLNILNPDAFIVRQNLARYYAGAELDLAYIGSLSSDAMPHIVSLLHEEDTSIRDALGPLLRYQLMQLDRRVQVAGWPSYHFSINRGYTLLDAQRSLVESYEPISPYFALTRGEAFYLVDPSVR